MTLTTDKTVFSFGKYILTEKNWTGIFADDNLLWIQGVYSDQMGKMDTKLGVAIFNMNYLENSVPNRMVSLVTLLLSNQLGSLGIEYTSSDKDVENKSIVTFVSGRIKSVDMSLGYFHAERNSTLDPDFSRSDFIEPIGFYGYNFIAKFKLYNNISSDFKIFRQIMAHDGAEVTRFQFNFNFAFRK